MKISHNIKNYILACFLFNISILYSQNNISDVSKDVKIGIYIDNIYNIDYLKSSYEVVFYIWANSFKKYYPVNRVDIDRSIEVEKVFTEIDSIQTINGKKFNCFVKYRAKLLNKMDISKYPFDKLNIKLDIELLGHYKGEKNINIDLKNSLINPFFIDKWNVDKSKTQCKIETTNWASNFGDISHKENSQLESLNLNLVLNRNSWNLYWKMFLVLFISFVLAALNLYLPNNLSEEKFALIVGALFTAIGNKYITESYLPFTDKMNLCDYLHIITFIFISLFALYAIYEQRADKRDSLKLDLKLFLFSIFMYFGIVITITYYFI